jgi:hypothetical protein
VSVIRLNLSLSVASGKSPCIGCFLSISRPELENKEKLQLMKERIHGGKYMEVEIFAKHGLLNDGRLGLLRFKMLLSRTAKHKWSVMKVKARKSYDNKRHP